MTCYSRAVTCYSRAVTCYFCAVICYSRAVTSGDLLLQCRDLLLPCGDLLLPCGDLLLPCGDFRISNAYNTWTDFCIKKEKGGRGLKKGLPLKQASSNNNNKTRPSIPRMMQARSGVISEQMGVLGVFCLFLHDMECSWSAILGKMQLLLFKNKSATPSLIRESREIW